VSGDPYRGTDRPTIDAYSEAGPEALLRLGLDVRAPLQSLRPAFDRLLPEASPRGYFGALREAFCRGEVSPGDDDGQLDWLAAHLHLSAPSADDLSLSWRRAWETATGALDRPAPQELCPRARRVLLDELLSRPSYRLRLADALTAALLEQLNS
jgi:hypothetical protein